MASIDNKPESDDQHQQHDAATAATVTSSDIDTTITHHQQIEKDTKEEQANVETIPLSIAEETAIKQGINPSPTDVVQDTAKQNPEVANTIGLEVPSSKLEDAAEVKWDQSSKAVEVVKADQVVPPLDVPVEVPNSKQNPEAENSPGLEIPGIKFEDAAEVKEIRSSEVVEVEKVDQVPPAPDVSVEIPSSKQNPEVENSLGVEVSGSKVEDTTEVKPSEAVEIEKVDHVVPAPEVATKEPESPAIEVTASVDSSGEAVAKLPEEKPETEAVKGASDENPEVEAFKDVLEEKPETEISEEEPKHKPEVEVTEKELEEKTSPEAVKSDLAEKQAIETVLEAETKDYPGSEGICDEADKKSRLETEATEEEPELETAPEAAKNDLDKKPAVEQVIEAESKDNLASEGVRIETEVKSAIKVATDKPEENKGVKEGVVAESEVINAASAVATETVESEIKEKMEEADIANAAVTVEPSLSSAPDEKALDEVVKQEQVEKSVTGATEYEKEEKKEVIQEARDVGIVEASLEDTPKEKALNEPAKQDTEDKPVNVVTEHEKKETPTLEVAEIERKEQKESESVQVVDTAESNLSNEAINQQAPKSEDEKPEELKNPEEPKSETLIQEKPNVVDEVEELKNPEEPKSEILKEEKPNVVDEVDYKPEEQSRDIKQSIREMEAKALQAAEAVVTKPDEASNTTTVPPVNVESQTNQTESVVDSIATNVEKSVKGKLEELRKENDTKSEEPVKTEEVDVARGLDIVKEKVEGVIENVQIASSETKAEESVKADDNEPESIKEAVEEKKTESESTASRDLPVQETATKPTQKSSSGNNILSKVKHSIVKVKKAITGKSPSSKPVSNEVIRADEKN